jgi:hypothetical protein
VKTLFNGYPFTFAKFIDAKVVLALVTSWRCDSNSNVSICVTSPKVANTSTATVTIGVIIIGLFAKTLFNIRPFPLAKFIDTKVGLALATSWVLRLK